MNHEHGFFEGVGGCRLVYETWTPEEQPKAVLVIVHGAGEHLGRYKKMVEALVPSGFAVSGYDLRGFGRSDGSRGHIDAWADYRGDLAIFLQQVLEAFPDIPFFIYGHSLGTLIVLDYIQKTPNNLAGAILSGAVLETLDAAPALQVFMAKLMSKLIPTFSMKVPLPGSFLSRDPAVAQAYDDDPLVTLLRSARWGTESLGVIQEIEAHPEKVTLPTLFLHGEKDPLVSATGARQFFDRLPGPDKTFRLFPDGKHEPHNDLDYQEVHAEITAWLAAHL